MRNIICETWWLLYLIFRSFYLFSSTKLSAFLFLRLHMVVWRWFGWYSELGTFNSFHHQNLFYMLLLSRNTNFQILRDDCPCMLKWSRNSLLISWWNNACLWSSGIQMFDGQSDLHEAKNLRQRGESTWRLVRMIIRRTIIRRIW